MFLVYKLETFKDCKEVNLIMIMIIPIIYISFILCDIWSTVENPTLFVKIENFSSPFPPPTPHALCPAERGEDTMES